MEQKNTHQDFPSNLLSFFLIHFLSKVFLIVPENLATQSFEGTETLYKHKGLPTHQEVEMLQQKVWFFSDISY